jgi:hypothetical protein
VGLDFQKAFYIKLGRGGKWEPDSIKRNRLRIGWKDVESLRAHHSNPRND